MSWSISATGTKAEALSAIRSQAANLTYKPGTPEGDDVVAAVARIEALAECLEPSAKVNLNAYGSHSTHSMTPQSGITSASFSVNVSIAS
jgi:hypothetical protein